MQHLPPKRVRLSSYLAVHYTPPEIYGLWLYGLQGQCHDEALSTGDRV